MSVQEVDNFVEIHLSTLSLMCQVSSLYSWTQDDNNFCLDYCGLIEDAEMVAGLKGPLILMLASEEERATPWVFEQLLTAATMRKKRVDVHLYPNALHVFHRPKWEGHDAEAANDSWEKTLLFLSQFR
jgi:hypothetical protein